MDGVQQSFSRESDDIWGEGRVYDTSEEDLLRS